MFGNELRKNAYEIIKDSYQDHKIDSEELLEFLERITDESLSRDLSYRILDALAIHDDIEVLNLLLKEYRRRCMVVSINLKEYPDLFNRRMYIPIRYNLDYTVLSIISSLRVSNYEECYLIIDNKKYEFNGKNNLKGLSILDLRYAINVELIYGKDSWNFIIKPIGLSYFNPDEDSMPYLVIDGVGYGIEGMAKSRLFEMLDESIELSIDTHNPIMDDEDFEFYNADCDNLNENAQEDFEYTYKEYIKTN